MPAGIYAANCYIVYSETTKDGIVVDPGGDVDQILGIIEKNNIAVQYIILTHGHGDHIGGIVELKAALNVPILIHEGDMELLTDGNKNLSTTMAMGTVEIKPDSLVNDGDILKFGDLEALIIHTPGHTKGGISIKIKDNIITGDTLFAGSIGRTDLLGGDFNTIIKSIKEKLLIYPDDTIVFPGHGEESTIGNEKKHNPFLR